MAGYWSDTLMGDKSTVKKNADAKEYLSIFGSI